MNTAAAMTRARMAAETATLFLVRTLLAFSRTLVTGGAPIAQYEVFWRSRCLVYFDADRSTANGHTHRTGRIRSVQKIAVFLVTADPGPGITAKWRDRPPFRSCDLGHAAHQVACGASAAQGDGSLHMPDHEIGPAPFIIGESDLPV